MTKFKNPLQARDGIVDNHGCFHFVEALVFRGPRYGEDPSGDDEVLGVIVDFDGERKKLYTREFRRATFLEYAFNYKGFGKTPWLRFIVSLMIVMAGGVFCLTTTLPFNPEWSRYAVGLGCLVGAPLMWTWATYRNHTGYWV